MNLPRDIYTITLSVAKAYNTMLKRRDDYNSMSNSGDICADARRNNKKIEAVEQAWAACVDECERELIKKNLFEHVPMGYINLPMSERSMRRARKRFLIRLAERLEEI